MDECGWVFSCSWSHNADAAVLDHFAACVVS